MKYCRQRATCNNAHKMVGVYSFSYSFRTLNATFDHTEVFFSLFISFDELYDQPEIPFIQSQFQRFLYQTHKCKIQNISDGIFILSPGSCPTGGTLGRWGCPGGSKICFSNMVMWNIKLTGMMIRTECK